MHWMFVIFVFNNHFDDRNLSETLYFWPCCDELKRLEEILWKYNIQSLKTADSVLLSLLIMADTTSLTPPSSGLSATLFSKSSLPLHRRNRANECCRCGITIYMSVYLPLRLNHGGHRRTLLRWRKVRVILSGIIMWNHCNTANHSYIPAGLFTLFFSR